MSNSAAKDLSSKARRSNKAISPSGGTLIPKAAPITSPSAAETLKAPPAASFGFLVPAQLTKAAAGPIASAPPVGVNSVFSSTTANLGRGTRLSNTQAASSGILTVSGKAAIERTIATGSAAKDLDSKFVQSNKALLPSAATLAPKAAPTIPFSGGNTLKNAPAANANLQKPIASIIARSIATAPTEQRIVLDDSLGQSDQLAMEPNGLAGYYYTISPGMGRWIKGGNLFYSFSKFGLATGESVNFTISPAARMRNGIPAYDVHNILVRVTGSTESNIDGAIRSDIEGASLFLMNPNGVFFGRNASLDLKGSFAVTTANYIKLADGAEFDALPGINDRLLTSAAVNAFGFFPGKPARIEFHGDPFSTQFVVPEGANFTIVGGDETVNGTIFSAPSGRLSLVSIADRGEVSTVPAVPEQLAATPSEKLPPMGSITMANFAFLYAQSANVNGAGHVEIDGGNVNLSQTLIDVSAFPTHPGSAGTALSSVQLRCDSLVMAGSTISADPFNFGINGNIEIRAHDVALSNLDTTQSEIRSSASDHGIGGNITLVADSLTIVGSTVKTSTFGSGPAGNIEVMARDLRITGSSSFQATGILAESGSKDSGRPLGRGGDVNVVAEQLTLNDGGQISATTFGPGRGGNVSVRGQVIAISGASVFENVEFQSGIFASSELSGNEGVGGDGGSVMIQTQGLVLSNGGQISTSTHGSGNGGDATITADTILLKGSGLTLPTRIAATTNFERGGNGGGIKIDATSLQVLDGAEISASTLGLGAGGNVEVMAGTVLLSGPESKITAQTLAPEGGAGGEIRIGATSITVRDAANISASTKGSGQGGSIDLTANRIALDGSSASIRADTSGTTGVVSTEPFVQEISVIIGIDHTANSDIRATLVAPSDTQSRVTTLFRTGEIRGANLQDTTFSDAGATSIIDGVAPYTGIFRPVEALDLLRGGGVNGTWTLLVGDAAQQNTGTLKNWSVMINGKQFLSTEVPQPINDFMPISSAIVVALPTLQTQVRAGTGGNIRINATTLDVRNGGTVSASTHGDGAAGSLNIKANSVFIDATRAVSDTGFFASTKAGSTGQGGSISIAATDFQIIGSSRSGIDGGVVARSLTNAPAGDITLQASNVTLDANAIISSANLGGGPAGSVNLTASDTILLQNGSLITALSQASDAGVISLTAKNRIELHDNSTITASAGANGGNISIVTGDLFYLDHSSVVATAGTSLRSGAQGGGAGAGGNIFVDPTFIILDHGTISANAAIGQGGNIQLRADHFLSSESLLTATGSTDGTVEIISPELDIVSGLIGLPGSVLDVSMQLREQCARRIGQDFSSFLILGRGGVEPSPDEATDETSDEPAKRRDELRANGKSRQKKSVQLGLRPTTVRL